MARYDAHGRGEWSVTHGSRQTWRRGVVGEHDRLGKLEVTGVWEPEYGSAEEGSANLLGCRPCTEAVADSLTHGPRMGR
ncbi:hypothetical protein FH972_008241 [Carpinus fangiana]|uniref:Uncharacterized protein n=1 Tax=Carpinus fangiana TaxID=176857 RepID=A0A5N6QY24_9ROSI|nr:hypothetical protein FH972_008241 [Carpinus fangiana]